jgi:histidinol-phosphate/aromatic aminotransferase/cobyric acid decarboxylase-like protein
MRVGYGIAQPELATEIDQAGYPHAVTAAAEAAAVEMLRRPDALQHS